MRIIARHTGTCLSARKVSAETAPFPGSDFHSDQKFIIWSYMACEMRGQQGGPSGWGFLRWSCQVFLIFWLHHQKLTSWTFSSLRIIHKQFCVKVFCTITLYWLMCYPFKKYAHIKLVVQHLNPNTWLEMRKTLWNVCGGRWGAPLSSP